MRRHHLLDINYAFVKVRRKKLGITMHIASKRADISTKHWSNVENNRARPSIDIVIRMANALRCRADELLTSTSEMSINYLEMRMQETIQAHSEPDKKQVTEPLGIKEFLIISKMLGYFDNRSERQIGYTRAPQVENDESLLSEYHEMYQCALQSPHIDTQFIEFLITNQHHLQHLLSSQHRDELDTYMTDRGIGRQAIEGEVGEHEQTARIIF